MARPDFLCIGAQKAGTTWLDTMFRRHKQLWTPPVKELQYFNELFMPQSFQWTQAHRESHALRAINYSTSIEKIDWRMIELAAHIGGNRIDAKWYETIFDFAPEGSIKGEFTPEYSLLSKEHVDLIATLYGDTKIIVLMREPVSRAKSGIQMRLHQQGFSHESSESDIESFVCNAARDWDVIERGNYRQILEKWRGAFGEENVLCLLSDDLLTHPTLALDKISEFLNIDANRFVGNHKEKVHVGKKFSFSERAQRELEHHQQCNVDWFNQNSETFRLG